MLPILQCLLLAGAAAATDSVPKEPTLWDRYEHASVYGAAGAGIAGATFMLSMREADPLTMLAAGFGGAFLGGAFGIAWGANTYSTWDEENGSFFFDLVGTVGGALAGGLAGYGIGAIVLDDGDAGGLTVLGLVTAPLGAVLAQRALAGSPPRVSLWSPRSDDALGALGCRLEWSLP